MVRVVQPRGAAGHRGRSSSNKLYGGRRSLLVRALVALLVVTVLGSVLLFLLSRSFPTETAQLESMAEQELQLVEQKAQQELMKHHLVLRGGARGAAPENAVVGEQPQQQQQEPAAGGENNSNNQEEHEDTAQSSSCPYTSLADLSSAERFPVATAERHMVTPPAETAQQGVALVCCRTTRGPLSLLVHHAWAPAGARRFLDLVESELLLTIPTRRSCAACTTFSASLV